VFTAIWAGFLLATGIQPPPNIMIKIYAVALVFAGAWLFQYARLLPGRIFERYRDERLYPAVLQAWGVGVATIIFACIVGGVLLLLQSVFPSSAIIIMQIIMCCLAGLGFLGAVTIGIFLAIGMQDEAAMGSLSREPRQP
jgi:cytochrome b subunit of formate dehydrogenase